MYIKEIANECLKTTNLTNDLLLLLLKKRKIIIRNNFSIAAAATKTTTKKRDFIFKFWITPKYSHKTLRLEILKNKLFL